MKDNTARLVLAALLREPSKTAIGNDELELDRAALMSNVLRQAMQFKSEGVSPDSFVVVLCDRGLGFWTELLAAWIIGAKPICVEAAITDEHAASVIRMTNAQFIVGATETTSAEFSGLKAVASTFDPELSCPDLRLCYEQLPFASDDETPDMAGLIFTSGTTGLPKGVPLTHRALMANALSTAQRLRLRASDRLMIATPFRFISSISHFIVTLLSDAAFIGVERTLMIKDLLVVLNDANITAFGGSPFHMQFIAMAGDKRLPNLRWAMSSGDHLRPAVIDELSKNFANLELHVVYGMAELGGRFCELPPEALTDKAGSVGYPINGFEVSVRREDGSHCDPEEIGNLYVTGQLGFDGYFENPGANAKVLGPLGFLNGDKGYKDADGYLFLAGRSDSVFKRSGLKVSAVVINDEIMALAGVKDVFVGSEESAMEGHVPVAYICWETGQEKSDGDVIRELRALLPVNHIPARFVSLPTIPRTGSGKVDRRKLKALIEDQATA